MVDTVVMLSRSEASRWPEDETLRFAQGDNMGGVSFMATLSC